MIDALAAAGASDLPGAGWLAVKLAEAVAARLKAGTVTIADSAVFAACV